jgi:hypothetical protein
LTRNAIASILALVALALAVLAPARSAAAPPEQPIRYSHKVHVTDYKLDCRFCHVYAAKSASAGIPSLAKCMMCHRTIAAERPEIRKLAQYWKEKKPIPWVRVTELQEYTYFPHFRMVSYGKVPCLTCHPGIDRDEIAVQRQEFGMGWCLTCHRGRGVSIDCWTCHI